MDFSISILCWPVDEGYKSIRSQPVFKVSLKKHGTWEVSFHEVEK